MRTLQYSLLPSYHAFKLQYFQASMLVNGSQVVLLLCDRRIAASVDVHTHDRTQICRFALEDFPQHELACVHCQGGTSGIVRGKCGGQVQYRVDALTEKIISDRLGFVKGTVLEREWNCKML